MTRKTVLYSVAGFISLWALAGSTLLFPVPTLLSPYCFSVAVPVLALQFRSPGWIQLAIGISLVPAIGAIWSAHLLWPVERIPIRTKILAALIIVLSIIFLFSAWSYGLKYQGVVHTLAMYAYNFIFCAFLFVLFRNNSRSPSYRSNFFFHWTLFAYLAWIAFPWLGELP